MGAAARSGDGGLIGSLIAGSLPGKSGGGRSGATGRCQCARTGCPARARLAAVTDRSENEAAQPLRGSMAAAGDHGLSVGQFGVAEPDREVVAAAIFCL